jgi:TonB family protein
MNRLQKKCVIATAGFHLLLLVILFVGPAFFNPKPKVDDSQVLDVIPANLIDAAFNSAVKGAQPPPPTPIVTPPQQQPTPTPPAPKPIVQPTPVPQPTLLTRLETIFKPEPAKPVPTEIQPHTPKVDLHLVTRDAPKNSTMTKPKDNSRALKNLAEQLKHNLSSPTEVNLPGESSAAYASYANVVRSVYYQAWTTLPDNIIDANESVTVSVTIASDGTVISSHIVKSSGDANLDASVQRTLDRVAFVAPFPANMTEKEWTRSISFSPEVKKMSE